MELHPGRKGMVGSAWTADADWIRSGCAAFSRSVKGGTIPKRRIASAGLGKTWCKICGITVFNLEKERRCGFPRSSNLTGKAFPS